MKKRFKMSRQSSRKDFRRKASKSHPRNNSYMTGAMRGGIRL